MNDLTSFHDQVKRGDLAGVQTSLFENPALLDAPNEAGQSALLLAKYYRQPAVAEYLLGLGPQMDVFLDCVVGRVTSALEQIDNDPALLQAHSGDGWTPLHLAAFFGQKELAKGLLNRGAEVDCRSTNVMKNTPLHAAAAGRNIELMRLLLENGANPNATQEGGFTALHSAAQNGDRDTAELLLAHGADVNLRAANNQCALDFALMKGHHDLAALLEQMMGVHKQ